MSRADFDDRAIGDRAECLRDGLARSIIYKEVLSEFGLPRHRLACAIPLKR